MNVLIEVFKKASSMGFKELKTTVDFFNFPLAPAYSLYDWSNDQTIDRESRILVKTKALKAPFFIEQLVEQRDNESHLLHEFKYKDQRAAGFGAAYLFDSLAVSLANAGEWDKTSVELLVTQISEEGQLTESIECVNHASKPEHLDLLSQWISKKKRVNIPNGKLLWLKRKEYFPHLILCKNIENQVSSFSGGELEFYQITKRLLELEDFCSTWTTDLFTPGNIPSKITQESDSRISKFKDELTIICPDGEARLFSWHSRFTPGAGRIHFFPDNSKRLIYIGYIGPKIQ
ncbi:MAG: hypothetical protein QG657_5278 [Acidobacteriota bacterium]|nr:hypothetical protein [Acidobacteriota bacterium]